MPSSDTLERLSVSSGVVVEIILEVPLANPEGKLVELTAFQSNSALVEYKLEMIYISLIGTFDLANEATKQEAFGSGTQFPQISAGTPDALIPKSPIFEHSPLVISSAQGKEQRSKSARCCLV